MSVQKQTLPNGLRLLIKEDHTLPLIRLRLAITGGIRQESDNLAGVSMLAGAVWARAFKGTTAEALSRQVEARGGSLFSYSGKNSFLLEMNFLSEDTDMVLTSLDKLLKSPTFPQEEIDLQRSQMLTAIKARKDSPSQMAATLGVETLFLSHPFRKDGLGTEESLTRITRQDVVDYFNRFLSPDNMVISVFGDIKPDEIKARLQKSFLGLKTRNADIRLFDEPEPVSARVKELTMNKEQAIVRLDMRAPLLSDPDRYAMETAVNILTSSLSGRMFKRIREELGKAYTLGGYYSPGVDAGMVTIYVNTTNENIARVRSILDEEFHRLATERVPDKELIDTQTYLVSRQASSLETLGAQATSGTVNELLGLGFNNDDVYSARIHAVTTDDLRRVAARYLDPGRAAVIIIRSAEEIN